MKKKSPKPVLKLSTALFKGSFVHNPVLTQIIGICPIVGAATTFMDAVVLSVAAMFLLTVCETFTGFALKKVPRWLRMCIYTLLSLSVALVIDKFLFALTSNDGAGLGIYFYLLCVNAVIVIRCEKFACKTGALNGFIDGFAASIGYAAVAVVVGTVRELISYGTIFASADMQPKFSQSTMPFVALVILGFLAATHKWIIIKFYPDEITDTFSMKAVFEKPVRKDPGLFTDRRKQKPKVIREYKEIRPRHIAEKETKGGDE